MPKNEPSNYSTPQQIPIQSNHHRSTLTKIAEKFLIVRAIIGIASCIIPCVHFSHNTEIDQDNDVIINNAFTYSNVNINNINDHSVVGDFIEFFVESFQ